MDNQLIIGIKFQKNIVVDMKNNLNITDSQYNYVIKKNDNLYEIIKKMKPVKKDLIKFSDLLTKMKLVNNMYFLNNINSKQNKENKLLVEYSYNFNNNENFINQHIFNMDMEIQNFCLDIVCFTDYNLMEIKINIDNNNSYLTHEFVNPINIINLSSKFIEKNIIELENKNKKDKYNNQLINNIKKYNNFIKIQSNWSHKLIETFNNNPKSNFNNNSNNNPQFNLLSHSFNKEINNKIYYTKNLIKNNRCSNLKKTVKCLISFVNEYILTNIQIQNSNFNVLNINFDDYIIVDLNHFKIILDNVFKNIFGYISNIDDLNNNKKLHQKKLKSISLMRCKNLGFYKLIIKNNKNMLNNTLINTSKNTYCNNSKNTYCNNSNYTSSNNNNNTSKYNKGIGLQLINDLCLKNNLNWNILEHATYIEFNITIPIVINHCIGPYKKCKSSKLTSEIKKNISLKKSKSDSNLDKNNFNNNKVLKRKLSLSSD